MIGRTFQKYRQDKNFRDTINSSFASLLIRMAGMFTGFLATVITTRFFGTSALGIVAICLGVLSFAVIIGKLGFDVSLLRCIADFSAKNNYAAVKGVFLKALKVIVPVCILLTVVLFFSSEWIATTIFRKEGLTRVIQYSSFFVLPLVLLTVNSESLRGLKKINLYTFYQTTAVSALVTILLIVFAFFDTGQHIPVYIQFVCIGMASVFSFISFMKHSAFTKQLSSAALTVNDLLKSSTPIMVTTIMQLMMSWAGTLILAAYVTETDVGIYSALVRISTFTTITVLAVNSGMMPKFAIAHSTGNADELKQLAGNSVRIIFFSALPIFILLAVFPELVLKLFGKDFSGHETALYILLAGQFFVVCSGLPAQILNMTDKQHLMRNISIVSAIFNVLFCFLLIPSFGIIGACIAQIIGMVVWNILCIFIVYRTLGFVTFFRF